MSKLAATWSLIALTACGGSTASGGDAGHTRDAGHERDSGADSGNTTGCPTAQPSAGSACESPTLSCEYGSDPAISCDTVMTCEGTAWKQTQAPATSGCSKTNSAACPATFAAATGPMGQSCGAPVSCYYTEARCSCQQVCLGACGAPIDVGPAPLTWVCDIPTTTGCPIPRPRLGTSCTVDPLVCDYGGCEGNLTMQCQAGTWLAIGSECPG